MTDSTAPPSPELPHVVAVFVGRAKHDLGQTAYYRASLPAVDIRRAHARACEEIGIPHWGNLVDERRGLRESEAQALLRVPSLAGEIHDLWESSEHPWDFEIGWSEVYLRVAAHGATLLGLSLVWQVIEAEVIDAGGEAFGYVQ